MTQELTITKKNLIPVLESFTSKLNELFTNGELAGRDLLLLHVGTKILSKKMEAITKDEDNKDVVIDEFNKYGTKTVELGNYRLSKRAYKKYDYSQCNHPIVDMKLAIDDIFKDPIKDSTALLRKISSASNLGGNSVTLDRTALENLKELMMQVFDDMLDILGDEDVSIFAVNPAVIVSESESLIVKEL